jgi:GT2 family glycosyltransferase
VLGFVACAAVARRDALLAVGGFDEHYGFGGEELRLAVALAAAGWELRYAEDVVAHHHPARSATRAGRDARALRNDLWTAWAVRPRSAALRATARLVRAAGWRRDTLAGVLAALRGARRIARERRVAPPAVEVALRLLDGRARDAEARA